MPDPDQYRQKRLEIAAKLLPQLIAPRISASDSAKAAVLYADLLIQANESYPLPTPTAQSKPQPPLL
jgi:hypothetical protein